MRTYPLFKTTIIEKINRPDIADPVEENNTKMINIGEISQNGYVTDNQAMVTKETVTRTRSGQRRCRKYRQFGQNARMCLMANRNPCFFRK